MNSTFAIRSDVVVDDLLPKDLTVAEGTGRQAKLAVAALQLGVVDFMHGDRAREVMNIVDTKSADIIVFTYAATFLIAPPRRASGSPCYVCLARRWQLLRTEPERNALEGGRETIGSSDNPFHHTFSSALVTALLKQLLRDGVDAWPRTSSGQPLVFSLNADTLSVESYPLIPDAHCPNCGGTSTHSSIATFGQPRPKPSPDATRLKPVAAYGLESLAYANPVTGMLGSVAGYAFDSTTTAPVTGYSKVRGDHDIHEFFWSGHANDFATSETLAILEGLERHAGLVRRSTVPPVVASYNELGERAMNPRDMLLYPDKFYELVGPRFTKYSDDMVMPWVDAYSFARDDSLLVPSTYVHYLIRDHATNFLLECSNGCATGSCLEEAALYGLLELIERDAFLLGWYGRARLPEIDLSTSTSPDTRLMVGRLEMLGYDVRMFDNRIDLPIPVVTGVAVRRDGGPGTLCFAAGAGFDPEDAIAAALCEIASYVPGFDRRVESNAEQIETMIGDYQAVRELKHHALLFGSPKMRHHADYLLEQQRDAQPIAALYDGWEHTRPRNNDMTDDLRYVVDLLRGLGSDVIVADQTSPEQDAVGLATVATIVPALIPIDFGWNMQRALHSPRLRTAFVNAGWRDTPLRDEELNLVPHPFP